MIKRFCVSILTACLAVVFLLSVDGLFRQPALFGISPVQAQHTKRVKTKRAGTKRRSLLSILFGGPQKVKRADPRVRKFRKSRKSRKRKTRRRKGRLTKVAIVRRATLIPKVVKRKDAKTVLVVGDFFASGLAKGLKRAFAQSPGIRIIGKARGSSGFVRSDYYDWAAEIGPLIDNIKPIVVVVIAGTNDRQLMRENGRKLQKRSLQWDAAYNVRIENFVKTVRSKQVPMIWMGLPPVRFKNMNRDFLVFNEIYRNKTEKFGGQFIDVWDGFTDADGNFVISGPSVSGQIVRLRSRDGIKVTKSGQNKLAFYSEKAIRKLAGDNSAGILAALPVDPGTPAPVLEPAYDPAKTGRTGIIRLNDPTLAGDNVLAGAKPYGLAGGDAEASPPAIPGPPVVGRVDDYSWPRQQLESVPKNLEARSGRL